jgi:cytidylate kinase
VLSDVATALAERDRSDTTRPASPLAQAPDALHLETTGLSVEAVVDRVMREIEKAMEEIEKEKGRRGEE